MNILINYPKKGEGGPAFSLELAKGFMDNGHQVYAVLVDSVLNAEQWRETLPEGNVIFLKAHKPKDKISFILTTLRFLLIDCCKLYRKFKVVGIDVSVRTLYSHWGPMVDKAVSSKRIVAICHDPKAHSGANRRERLYYKFYHNADDVFVLTNSFVSETAEAYCLGKQKVHYIPHGRMNMYKSNTGLENLQKKYTKKHHLLFFGRIEKYKGLHVLAKAYSLICEKHFDVELTILGNGDFEEYRKEYAELPNLHIENRFIEDEEIGNFFALKNTIAVIPYVDATQSGVIPIAFEFGVPVVASDVGGIKEQLDNGNLGLLYDNNDPSKLAECLLKLMEDADLFEHQQSLMLEYRKLLNWNVIARQFLNELL